MKDLKESISVCSSINVYDLVFFSRLAQLTVGHGVSWRGKACDGRDI